MDPDLPHATPHPRAKRNLSLRLVSKVADQSDDADIDVNVVLVGVQELDRDVLSLAPLGELDLGLPRRGVCGEVDARIRKAFAVIGRTVAPQALHDLQDFLGRHIVVLLHKLHLGGRVCDPHEAGSNGLCAARAWATDVEVRECKVLCAFHHQIELGPAAGTMERLKDRDQRVLDVVLCPVLEEPAIVGLDLELFVQQARAS
mmetsp:Transcript_4479/g.16988  ORF Transcript_4479/g.16988 Transcript_4479/m.16988 type:complete len:202 (+) Transcript_4479:687-1292(+)